MKDKYFYHLTDKECLDEILKNGLKPKIGRNSEMVHETEPAIYLCRRKDLPYWKIQLGKSIVLQISNFDESDAEHCVYNGYDEWICKKDIPAENIKRVYTAKPESKHMKDLCIGYISSLNKCCEVAARYYNNPYSQGKEYLNHYLDVCLGLKDRLDYSVVPKEDIKDELVYWGENGAFTFVDWYLNTDYRLYEQLVHYPTDNLIEKRKALHDYIKETFDGCLTVETGGWC